MATPPSVAHLKEEAFGQAGWGRRGEFLLGTARVRFERSAETLSLFEPLPAGMRTPLRFNWAGPAGDSTTTCEAWTPEAGANVRTTGAKPWVLSCRWSNPAAAMLQVGEGQVRSGKLGRDGAYRRGELTLGLRSVHLLEGNAEPQTAAVGYEMLREGQVVGSLDLSGNRPRLRRPDPATPVGRAVTEAALALALAWEP